MAIRSHHRFGFVLALLALAGNAAPAEASCGRHAVLPGETCSDCTPACREVPPAAPITSVVVTEVQSQDAWLIVSTASETPTRRFLPDEPLAVSRHRAAPPVPPPRPNH